MKRGRLELAVGRSIRASKLAPADAAVMELAREYARVLDKDAVMLPQVGRQFLETLTALGMTPKARAALLKDAPPEPQAAPGLDELRSRRERRA